MLHSKGQFCLKNLIWREASAGKQGLSPLPTGDELKNTKGLADIGGSAVVAVQFPKDFCVHMCTQTTCASDALLSVSAFISV